MNRTLSISHQLTAVARSVLYGFLFLFPLFFLPFTLDPLEINKQSFLLICVCIAFVLLIGSVLLKKEVRLKLGWSQIFPIALCVTFAVSAFFSFAPYVSWIGTSGAEYTSVLSWVGLSLLFYLFTVFQKELAFHKNTWMILVASAVLTGLIGVLSVFGVTVFPFFPTLATSAFNTIGTVNTLAIFLVVMSLFACSMFITNSVGAEKGWKQNFVFGALGLLFLETLALLLVLDYGLLWILFLFGNAAIFVFAIFRQRAFPSTQRLFVPVLFTAVSVLFWFFLPSPFTLHLPLEITPSIGTSTLISNMALHDHYPLIGTGPGTYAIDYAKYHPININETDFWNTRFDRASSFFLTLVPTVGYVGAMLYLIFLAFLFYESVHRFVTLPLSKGEAWRGSSEPWIHLFHVFIPWLTLSFASFLLPFNITLLVALMIFSGLLVQNLSEKETLIKFSQNKAIALLSALCFVAFAFVLFIGIFLTTGRYAAEIAYTKAIRADRTKSDSQTIVTLLDRAATLNQWNDDYVRNLSAGLLLRVQDELKSVSSTAPLSDASKKYVQALVAASVNASAHATALSPHMVANWLTRGENYRSLTGLVDQSSKFSLDAYKHAIDLEPLNPNHWNELGKTELAIADAVQPLTTSPDSSVATKAKTDWQSALDESEKDFTKATELKSNFAPAHYQLALVYEREGKLDLAIEKLASVEKYNDTDIGVEFELGMLYTKRGKTGDLDQAKRVFSHVIDLAPSYSDAHWFLASIYEKQGDRANAIKEIESVLKLNPNNQIVKTRLAKLKSALPSP